MAKQQKTIILNRRVDNGRFVTEEYRKKHPNTTDRELQINMKAISGRGHYNIEINYNQL